MKGVAVLNGTVSIVKAVFDYFGDHPGGMGRVAEFKELTERDRAELRELLAAEGYDIAPLKDAA